MICGVCGCSDDDACVWFAPVNGVAVEHHCLWVAPNLCSACAPELAAEPEPEREPAAPEPLLFDAAGRPAVFR